MANMYIGDGDNTARKILHIYIGDSKGIARKVTQAFIGNEDNVARTAFKDTPTQSIKFPNLNALDIDRCWHTCSKLPPTSTFPNGALVFSGGMGSDYYIRDSVEIYHDVEASRYAQQKRVRYMRSGKCWHNQTSVGNYAVIGGGATETGSYNYNFDVFDIYGTRTDSSLAMRYDLVDYAAFSIKNDLGVDQGVFVGGESWGTGTSSTEGCAFDDTLTQILDFEGTLAYARQCSASIANDSWAAVIGGNTNSSYANTPVDKLDIYDNNLANYLLSSLPEAHGDGVAAAFVKNTAIIVGGPETRRCAALDVNENSLTISDNLDHMNVSSTVEYSGTTLFDKAVFMGPMQQNIGPISVYHEGQGEDGPHYYRTQIPADGKGAYLDSVTTATLKNKPSGGAAAGTLGNYAVFTGGYPGAYYGTTTVDSIYVVRY